MAFWMLSIASLGTSSLLAVTPSDTCVVSMVVVRALDSVTSGSTGRRGTRASASFAELVSTSLAMKGKRCCWSREAPSLGMRVA